MTKIHSLISCIQALNLLPSSMSKGSEPEWRYHLFIGLTLLTNSIFFQIAPDGPWTDKSFTLGILGLLGGLLCYMGWYRLTFKRKGLIPWLDLWTDPSQSAKKEILFAFIILFLAWFCGNYLQNQIPEPTGLILSLVGLMMLLQSSYVLLSIGPLKE